jgi:tungstate transport system ATP-binding protein
MLFQRPFMWHMSALGNVRLAAWLGQASWREARQQAQTALAQVSLAAQASQMARTLSGGQQQRLALARAWVQQPQILLLDEPTANLDPQAKREVEQLVGDWSQNTGAGLLFASHNLGQVKRLATRVLYLEAGAVLADLPVETFFNAPLAQTHPQAHAFLKGELG